MASQPPLMSQRVKLHDGVIGLLLIASTGLAVAFDPRFGWLSGLTGLIMLSSAFTGFCPVHFVIRRLMPDVAER